MSPEQAGFGRLDLDTRTDIYALGVLLYELLTGTTPVQRETLRQAALDEIRRMIRETEPPKPSTRLHDLGVELIDVPPSTRAGKNGADVRLVIDALELCYLREHIDTFVIASGDSDFCPLAHKLRENDRTVVGMAVKESTSPLFVKACDEFMYLRGPGQRRRGGGHEKESEREKPKEKVIPEVAREAAAALLAKATAPINPSAIKEAIVRKEPDFDERDHGFSSFNRLLEAMEKEKLLRREQGAKGQWYGVAS
jgi:uncharacterized LabA/DUF88 family protein